MKKTTAVARSIQGLVKYHGLKEKIGQIPMHDSISVCLDKLRATATVGLEKSGKDSVSVNEKPSDERDTNRIKPLLDAMRGLSGYGGGFRVEVKKMANGSAHSYKTGKGVGFSASVAAAISTACLKVLGSKEVFEDKKLFSSLLISLSDAAARSATGGFSRLYVSKKYKECYSVQLADAKSFSGFRTLVFPMPERAGGPAQRDETYQSPLFYARLLHLKPALKSMNDAIDDGDFEKVGQITEKESFILHSTSPSANGNRTQLEPESLEIYKQVKKLREQGVKAYVSWDTGPSTFVNTSSELVERVEEELSKHVKIKPIVCCVGPEVEISKEHLF